MSKYRIMKQGETLDLVDGLYIKGKVFGGIAICIENADHKLNLRTEHMVALRDFLTVQLEGITDRTYTLTLPTEE